jgi:hypothetical protein
VAREGEEWLKERRERVHNAGLGGRVVVATMKCVEVGEALYGCLGR